MRRDHQIESVRSLPETGFSRLTRALAFIPVSPAVWWRGVADGGFPPSVKLARNITAWRNEHLHELIERPEAPKECRSWNRKDDGGVGAMEQPTQRPALRTASAAVQRRADE